MAYITRRERCPLGAVETWIFDLDNTLYPASCRLFDQVQRRMTEFICERLSLSFRVTFRVPLWRSSWQGAPSHRY